MGQNTSRLGLYLPGGGSTGLITPDEPADIDKINDNMTKLDADAGAYVCTSSTRPATPYNGKIIFETDTRKTLIYKSATTSWEPVDSQGKIVANAAARDALFASPTQGTKVFRTDTGITETYYAAWNASTNPGGRTPAGWYVAERSTGLVPIVPPTVRVGGGSATANSLGKISFTSTASIALDNVFTSNYDFYRIFLQVTSASAASYANFRFTTGGTATTATLFYGGGSYDAAGATNQPYASLNGAADLATMNLINSGYDSTVSAGEILIYKSGNAHRVLTNTQSYPNGAGNVRGAWIWNQTSTSYDGFRIMTSTGTMSGYVQLFGYNS